jgi:hypothetical protein
MGFDESVAHFPDACSMRLIQDQLVRVRTTVMAHSHGFATPNQLGT